MLPVAKILMVIVKFLFYVVTWVIFSDITAVETFVVVSLLRSQLNCLPSQTLIMRRNNEHGNNKQFITSKSRMGGRKDVKLCLIYISQKHTVHVITAATNKH